MSARSVSSRHSSTWPMMLTWVYQSLSSSTSSATRGSSRMCSSRLRPSSMFTRTRPSSHWYHVAAETGWPSRRRVCLEQQDYRGLGKRWFRHSGLHNRMLGRAQLACCPPDCDAHSPNDLRQQPRQKFLLAECRIRIEPFVYEARRRPEGSPGQGAMG